MAQVTEPTIPERYWAYGDYDDGSKIEKPHRVLYRERGDLQKAFPDPFATAGGGFKAWLAAEGLMANG